MRSREQFKAYVYAKADAARAKRKKMYRLALGGAAAFCVCVCVGSAFFFSEMRHKSGTDYFLAAAPDYAVGTQVECNAEITAALAEAVATDATCAMDKATAGGPAAETGSADSSDEDTEAPAAKKYLFSVNACPPSYGLAGAPHCEILENDTEEEPKGGGAESVKVGISACFLTKPSVSRVTVDYSGEAITITVFADQTPNPCGSYLHYFTETLDGDKYVGQPIELDFKLTQTEDTNSES